MQLGVTTTTGDAEGAVLETRPVQLPDGSPISRAHVEAACASFVGPIDQLPPMYSALKRDGKPLYEYARAGIEIEDRQPRRITIHAITMLPAARKGAAPHLDPARAAVGAASAALPAQATPARQSAAEAASTGTTTPANRYILDIRCSKGTYIRTLVEDIGKALGCGAHLAGLRRTATGPLMLADALTLPELEAMDERARDAVLHPADMLLADWPLIRLDAENAGRFLSGLRRRMADQPDMPNLRVYGPEAHAFLGSGHITAGELISDRLLSPIEVAGLIAAVPRHQPDRP